MKGKVMFAGAIALALVVGFGLNYVNIGKLPMFRDRAVAKKAGTVATTKPPAPVPRPLSVTADNAPTPDPVVIDGVKIRYNPYRPSGGPYPQLKSGEKIWIDVSISQQLVYIFNGQKRLYTMATSSGLDTIPDNSTPLGVYHIQAERGTWFYTPSYQEGGKYWVSWLGHGVFLFHSVPMNSKQQIILPVAAKLLHKASHGCFHLTIPDAKWVYEHVPYGTTVVVEQAPVYLKGNLMDRPSGVQKLAIKATEPAKSSSAV